MASKLPRPQPPQPLTTRQISYQSRGSTRSTQKKTTSRGMSRAALPQHLRMRISNSRIEARTKVSDDLWSLTADMRKPKLKPLDFDIPKAKSKEKGGGDSDEDTDSDVSEETFFQKKPTQNKLASLPPRPAHSRKVTKHETESRAGRKMSLAVTKVSREPSRASLKSGAASGPPRSKMKTIRGPAGQHTSRINSRQTGTSSKTEPAADPDALAEEMALIAAAAKKQEKEFTFTGYDIMADVDSEGEEASQTQEVKLYCEACRRMGISPSSQINKMINTPDMTLTGCSLGPQGVQPLCVALVSNPSVVRLGLSDNFLEEIGADYVSQLLGINDKIERLDLSENRIRTGGLESISNTLIHANTTLIELNLSGNELDDLDANSIADLIQSNNTLRILNLSHNALREKGALSIGKALTLNETLQDLDLSWNHLRGKGAVCIARGLQKNAALRHLNLSFNGFKGEGAVALGQALGENGSLRTLDISHNQLGADSVKPLLQGLKSNTALAVLKIGHNSIPARLGTIILRAVLLLNDSPLVEIDLTGTVVYDDFEDMIKQVQENRPNFKCKYDFSVKKTKQAMKDNGPINEKADPMSVVFEYLRAEGYSLSEAVTRDELQVKAITNSEFKTNLLKLGIPITDTMFNKFLEQVYENKPSENVQLAQLIKAEKKYRKELLKAKQAAEKEARAKGQEIEEYWPYFPY